MNHRYQKLKSTQRYDPNLRLKSRIDKVHIAGNGLLSSIGSALVNAGASRLGINTSGKLASEVVNAGSDLAGSLLQSGFNKGKDLIFGKKPNIKLPESVSQAVNRVSNAVVEEAQNKIADYVPPMVSRASGEGIKLGNGVKLAGQGESPLKELKRMAYKIAKKQNKNKISKQEDKMRMSGFGKRNKRNKKLMMTLAQLSKGLFK